MKARTILPLATILAFAHTATAQDIIKADNTDALNLTSSWDGGSVPGSTNVAVWDATVTAANSADLGADQSWHGIRVSTPGGNVTITGSDTLTLGASGIAITGRSLTLANPTTFGSDADLTLNSNHTLAFTGTADLGGNTLTVISGNEGRIISGTLTNGTLRFNSGPHNGHVQFNAASTGSFTIEGADNAQIIVNNTAASNSQLDVALTGNSWLRMTNAFNNGTLQIGNLSGAAGSRINTNFGAGAAGVVRTLQVNQTTADTFAGTISQADGNRAIGLIKAGAATLSLTNTANAYTGPTTINTGTLRIAGAGRLNNGSYAAAITNNATLHFDSTANQTLSGTITGNGDILKSNTGILTITGDASGFSGNTTINGGRLFLNGSSGGDVSANSGGTFGGTGSSTGDLDMNDGSTVLLTGGFTTDGPTFDSVAFNGTVYLEFAESPVDATEYDVVSYGAGGRSGFANLVPLARGTLTDDTANNKITFTSGAPGIRTWSTGDGVWDRFGILQNWAEGDKVFYQGDDVVFGDIASDTTITLDGLLAPFSVEVQNTTNTYTFAGTGGLSGNFFFDKLEDGTLAIANPNPNFTGSTFVEAGVFRFIDGGSWGTGSFTNNATLEVNQSTNLSLANTITGTGTLVKNGGGTLTLSGGSNSYNAGDITVNNGTLQLGATYSSITVLNQATPRTVTVNNGGTLEFFYRNAFGTVDSTVTTALVIDGGTVTSGGTGAVNSFNSLTLNNGAVLHAETGQGGNFGTYQLKGTVNVGGTSASTITASGNASAWITVGNGIDSTGITTFNVADASGDDSADLIVNARIRNSWQLNRAGGLTKTGNGTMLLNADNTYTGNTTVDAGTLELAAGAQLRFVLGATSGTNNSISGSGTVILNGDFVIDTTAADALETGTWTLENVSTLTGPYGATFSVVGFTDAGGNMWTKPNGPTKVYTFDETTGTLTLGPVGGDPFDDWATANGLDGSPGKEAGFDDDPDGDGVANGLEWILGGNPLNGQSGTLVTTTATAAGGLTLSFTRNEDSIGEATLTVEYNTNLGAVWNSAAIGATSSVEANGVTITIDTAPTPDAVTVNIPATNAPGGKLFARIKATNP